MYGEELLLGDTIFSPEIFALITVRVKNIFMYVGVNSKIWMDGWIDGSVSSLSPHRQFSSL